MLQQQTLGLSNLSHDQNSNFDFNTDYLCTFPAAGNIWLIFYSSYHLVYSKPMFHREIERILSTVYFQTVSHHRFVLQKDNFYKPHLPFFLPGQCCILYSSTLARWWRILRIQFRQRLPQPVLTPAWGNLAPCSQKGLPTFPRIEKDRKYFWVKLMTAIK